MKQQGMIRDRAGLEEAVRRYGILPFFANRVPGWSLEERIDPGKWFTDDDGPWEWKGPLAYGKACVYGKFIRNKAAFVNPEWVAQLANYRRDGLSFEERAEAGLAPHKDRLLMAYVAARPGELSKYARRECGFSQGYDGVLTRLQMQTYLIDQDFRYSVDKYGRPYGWGNAALIRAEDWLGEDFLAEVEDLEPEASFELIVDHLRGVLPGVDEEALRKELK